ncbi:MFS transporter [Thermodesulfobacteriota bacterium]
MISKFLDFYKTGPDKLQVDLPSEKLRKVYERKRWNVFLGITIGYGFFYVTRLTFSVVKVPIFKAGILTESEAGMIGSALFFVYAFGKLSNGVLADYCNIRKFMSTGLLVSAAINLILGFSSAFWVFFALWGFNGWFQAMGSAPSVVTLSQWFATKERGTRYGIWYVSHSIGEGITYIGTAAVVGYFGWRAGFGAAGSLCILMGIILIFMLADRPKTLGLPSIAEYKDDPFAEQKAQDPKELIRQQIKVLKVPAVWILGIASALTYVARYSILSWGPMYLEVVKGYDLKTEVGPIMGIGPIIGIAGGALSGIISDRIFDSNRHKATLLYGLLQITGLAILFYGPPGYIWLDYLGMGIFGFAIAGTVAFLGGLTAIDLTPRQVTGAVMGVIGLFSYMGAAVQDTISGFLIESGKTVVDGKAVYDFDTAIMFWFGSAVISIIVAMTVWNAKPRTSL